MKTKYLIEVWDTKSNQSFGYFEGHVSVCDGYMMSKVTVNIGSAKCFDTHEEADACFRGMKRLNSPYEWRVTSHGFAEPGEMA